MSPPQTEPPRGSPRGFVGVLALAAGFAGGYVEVAPAIVRELEPPKVAVAPKPSSSAPEPAPSASAPEPVKVPEVERAGFVDRTGGWAIAAEVAQARPFSEGLARVAVGDRWGFVDEQGKTVIAPSFAEADDCSEGL